MGDLIWYAVVATSLAFVAAGWCRLARKAWSAVKKLGSVEQADG